VESINLLTIGLPNLLDEMVLNAFSKKGVLAKFERFDDLQQYLAGDSTDVSDVILVESMSSDECISLMQLYQNIRLVSVDESGKSFSLWELVSKKQVLGELSLDELVNRILDQQSQVRNT
jgi:hypothetical protein